MARTLKEVLDYRSGDSWNGTHDRCVDVSVQEDGSIVVDNNYSNHHVTKSFTAEQICDQLGEAREARYYRDFCYEAGRKIPGFFAVTDDQGSATDVTNPSMIETDVKRGVKNNLTVNRPLQLKLKP